MTNKDSLYSIFTEAVDFLEEYEKGLFFAYASGVLKRHLKDYHLEMLREQLEFYKRRQKK